MRKINRKLKKAYLIAILAAGVVPFIVFSSEPGDVNDTEEAGQELKAGLEGSISFSMETGQKNTVEGSTKKDMHKKQIYSEEKGVGEITDGQLTESELILFEKAKPVSAPYEIDNGRKNEDGDFIPYSLLCDPASPDEKDKLHGGSDCDSRKVVINTTVFPARAVVQIRYETETGEEICSGAMISKDTVLTAGHCVHSGTLDGIFYSDHVVYPGRNGAVKPFGKCEVTHAFVLNGWVEALEAYKARNYDLGALKLNCNIGLNTGWFGLKVLEDEELGVSTTVHGYTAAKTPRGKQWISLGDIKKMSRHKGFYLNDTNPGTSGAAVYSEDVHEIFGIHTNGIHNGPPWNKYNAFTRITRERFNIVSKWINSSYD